MPLGTRTSAPRIRHLSFPPPAARNRERWLLSRLEEDPFRVRQEGWPPLHACAGARLPLMTKPLAQAPPPGSSPVNPSRTQVRAEQTGCSAIARSVCSNILSPSHAPGTHRLSRSATLQVGSAAVSSLETRELGSSSDAAPSASPGTLLVLFWNLRWLPLASWSGSNSCPHPRTRFLSPACTSEVTALVRPVAGSPAAPRKLPSRPHPGIQNQRRSRERLLPKSLRL